MLEIYKTESEHKEYIEGLLELLSEGGMGPVKNVLQMVLYEDGTVTVDSGKMSTTELMLFKGHLEFALLRRFLSKNGCSVMLGGREESPAIIGWDEAYFGEEGEDEEDGYEEDDSKW